MICYDWRASDKETMAPSGQREATKYVGQHDHDYASRQQTFASDGDAIFFPKSTDPAPTARPFESSSGTNSAHLLPRSSLGNPFSNNQPQVSQQQQHPQPQHQFSSLTPTTQPNSSPESQSPNRFLAAQASNGVPLLRTGAIHEARGSTRSSPSLSVESAAGGSAPSSVQMNASYQDSSMNSATLPTIPDIRNERLGNIPQSSRRSTSVVSMSSQSSDGSSRISFSFFTPSTHVRNNPKNGMMDILLQIIVQVSSIRGGVSNAKTSHTIYKWYSDLRTVHERYGIHQKQISFPVILYPESGTNISENDRLNLQKYMLTLAESILDVDYQSTLSQQILSFLEDESHSLSDKIRMLLLESRLMTTMDYCDRLQNRLQIAEQNLNDSTNLVSFLRFRVEQLENANTSHQRNQSDPAILKNEHHQSFQQQQAPSMHISGYNVSSTKNGVSYNNVDNMFAKQMRINDGINTSNFVTDSNVNPSQLVTLAEAVLNEKGPLPVGEVGKMLQEATGNPHLSQVLKERHNGLKKFLEKYSDKFIMSCDHPFNPHVYLRRSYSPDDQRMIENGSTAFLDKKVKKTRRKEKKAWPAAIPPSPTIGSYQATKIYSS